MGFLKRRIHPLVRSDGMQRSQNARLTPNPVRTEARRRPVNTDAGRLSLQWLSRDTREKSALKLAEREKVYAVTLSPRQCVRDIGSIS